jgi:low temperature requirement protein LtrA
MRPSVLRNLRNIAIVLALAAVVDLVPGGGAGANVALAALALAFLAIAAWIGSRLYREHRVALYSLGDRRRAILYVALGTIVVVLTASSRMMTSGPGTVAWIVLLALSVYAVFAVVWSARQY